MLNLEQKEGNMPDIDEFFETPAENEEEKEVNNELPEDTDKGEIDNQKSDDTNHDDDELDLELDFLGEVKKLKKSEAKPILQKGMNYDHVYGKMTEYEKGVQRMEAFARSLGHNSFADLEKAQAEANREIEVQKYAEANNVPDEVAAEQLRQREEINKLKGERIENIRNTQREALKSDPLFSEINELVNNTLKHPMMTNNDYETVYNYIAGTPQFRTRIIAENAKKVEEAKRLAEKQAIANIHDKKSRGISDSSDSTPDEGAIELSAAEKKMSMAFGNDPNEIASYVKKQTKK